MVLGAVLLIDSPLPELRIRLVASRSRWPFRSAIITMLLLSLVVRARANKVVTGVEGMIGEAGVAVTAARARRQGLCARRILGRRRRRRRRPSSPAPVRVTASRD